MIQLDYKSGIPIYDQLVNGIIRLKMLGALKSGDSLPSVRQLASQLGINPNTVQRSYSELERRGIIYSAPGKGSFIADSREASDAIREFFIKKFANAVKEAKQSGLTESDLLTQVNLIYKEEKK